MEASYKDRWIECAADAVVIRGYYFPWGTKRIPYQSIREVRRVPTAIRAHSSAEVVDGPAVMA